MQSSIEELQKLQLIIKNLVPTPIALTYQQENASLILAWENTIPMLSLIKGSCYFKKQFFLRLQVIC